MANKEQEKVQPNPKNERAAQDKKTQVAVKAKKSSSAQSVQPKKRRFAFVSDVFGELKKVAWPTRQETIRLTLIVLGLCLVMGFLLGGIDFGFSWLVQQVLVGG